MKRISRFLAAVISATLLFSFTAAASISTDNSVVEDVKTYVCGIMN